MKGQKSEAGSSLFCVLCVLLAVLCLPSSGVLAVTITADHLEYFGEEGRYVATGNVRIEKEGAVMTADRAVLFDKTSDVEASGSVVYEDDETFLNTDRTEMNLDTRTGKLYKALVFFKKSNYWINGDNIRKIKEDHYYAETAAFTTCDSASASNADWCFRGKDVDVVVGERVTARSVTYRIKGLPVLYSPYMWAPIMTERESGLLFPAIGSSSRKGFQFSPAYFWAIDDNRDATVYLDYFSKRGLGKGLEYRYLSFNDRGRWYAYHLRDTDLKKDFVELHGLHEYQPGTLKVYLDVNYVNEKDFYREYAFKRYFEAGHKDEPDFYREQAIRTQRFLQSTGEISTSPGDSRLYLLARYWVDLKTEDAGEPRSSAELGHVINPVGVGPFLFNMTTSAADFFREDEVRGKRFDIIPTLSHAFGDGLRFFQSLSLRETAYQLQNGSDFGRSPHRENLEYRADASTRFVKSGGSYTHIIEPSVGYRFIPETHSLPLFDSAELFSRTSQVRFSLLNIFNLKKISMAARITQPYELGSDADGSQLLPTRLEAYMRGPFGLKFDIEHDFERRETEKVNTEINVRVTDKTAVTVGERFTKKSGIKLLKAGLDSVLTQRWSVNSNIWYDLKNGGLRESAVKATYSRQCWAVITAFSRRPGFEDSPADYSFIVFIELKGLGTFNIL